MLMLKEMRAASFLAGPQRSSHGRNVPAGAATVPWLAVAFLMMCLSVPPDAGIDGLLRGGRGRRRHRSAQGRYRPVR